VWLKSSVTPFLLREKVSKTVGDILLDAEFLSFRDLLEKNQKFVLTTHINPDGDGLGSECALAAYVRRKGKQAVILNHSATPPNYAFLDHRREILQFDPKVHASLLADADVIIVLDTNHPDRLVSMKPFVLQSKATKVCIDHHLDAAEFADLYIIDEPSTATGEIVYRLLTYLDTGSIDKEIAVALYTAIMTDTGSFRYPKTGPEVHRSIAHLIEQGADPVEIYEQVFEQGSVNRLNLLGHALATMELVHGGKVAYLVITQKMLAETRTTEVDTDAFVPYSLSVYGVQIGMMFTELSDGVKVNFRSKGDIWINRLAKEFGGNGHKNAAGARLVSVRLSDILPKLLERSKAYTN
jgi:phosphoesterase RecJ-like protein